MQTPFPNFPTTVFGILEFTLAAPKLWVLPWEFLRMTWRAILLWLTDEILHTHTLPPIPSPPQKILFLYHFSRGLDVVFFFFFFFQCFNTFHFVVVSYIFQFLFQWKFFTATMLLPFLACKVSNVCFFRKPWLSLSLLGESEAANTLCEDSTILPQ